MQIDKLTKALDSPAKEHFENGEYRQSIQYWREKNEESKANTFISAKYAAKSYLALEQIDEAIECLKAASRLKGDDAETFKDLGNCYKAKGEQEASENAYRRAIEIKEEYAPAINNLGLLFSEWGRSEDGIRLIRRAIQIDPKNSSYCVNLAIAYKGIGDHREAAEAMKKAIKLQPNNEEYHRFQAGVYRETKDTKNEIQHLNAATKINPERFETIALLVNAHQKQGDTKESIKWLNEAIKRDMNNVRLYLEIARLYCEIQDYESSITSLKSAIDLQKNNTDALVMLTGLHELTNRNAEAMQYAILDVQLNGPERHSSINNISNLIKKIELKPENTQLILTSYSILLGSKNIAHQQISDLFIIGYYAHVSNIIHNAEEKIINTSEFRRLIQDKIFIKSITLFVIAHRKFEELLSRARKEILMHAKENHQIPIEMIEFANALAIQCFLNEYCYWVEEEEEQIVNEMITRSSQSTDLAEKLIPIIGAYKAIYRIDSFGEIIQRMGKKDSSSEELLTVQWHEPLQEQHYCQAIVRKQTSQERHESSEVRKMYEENPYPRYRFAGYTNEVIASPASMHIANECKRTDMNFEKNIVDPKKTCSVLIAGCGTGNQIIMASRYKNAWIKAIDLSSRSLAYAERKVKEYKMKNVELERMDLLDAGNSFDPFDIVECGGVLHHLESPEKGLSSLVKCLKKGGYIKIGLYSKLARKLIFEARAYAEEQGLKGNTTDIRKFRKLVLAKESGSLSKLSEYSSDFFSISECRDLCMHVQERCFNINEISDLMKRHDLIFCGFMIDPKTRENYLKQFPDDPKQLNLVNWEIYENSNPETFRGMYQFWAKKNKT